MSIINDSVNEGTENFSLSLANAGNATIADATGVGTILDDDTAVIADKSDGINLRVRPTSQAGVFEIRWTVSQVVLSRGANEFSLQFYVGGGTQWQEQWYTDEPTENGAPALIGGVPQKFCFRMVGVVSGSQAILGSGTSGNEAPCL